MKMPPSKTSDGLEWLRAVRREIQREIGQTPKERAAYYQSIERRRKGQTVRGNRSGRRVAA